MLDHILVPLDGSALAESTLPHVLALARAFSSHVTLLQVLDATPYSETGEQVNPLHWHIQRAEAQRYLTTIVTRLEAAGLLATAVLLEGRVADVVSDYAHHQQVDMIALCNHGRGGSSPWQLGGTAQRILERCQVSMLLVQGQPLADNIAEWEYTRVLVPLDGSPRAECALPVAVAIARHSNANLLLAHVVSELQLVTVTPASAEDRQLIERLTARNQREIERYFNQIQARTDLKFEIHLEHAPCATIGMQMLAAKLYPDLIVLSTHGFSSDETLPYGSVTHGILAYGTTSVLMVRDTTRTSNVNVTESTSTAALRDMETPLHA